MSEASGRYLIDTNIWLYALLQTESGTDKQKIARSIIESKNAVVSTQVINEVCVNLIKKALMSET
ncbi:PIN domain-containing protein [Coleofasciculus sp. F4-SAH-05]|uniref:PIN domain-containing protein n=1 Tax=Coleofasciculus sp. F4-SAH-05 TaxID=3069525 RepID=UPI003301C1C5